MVQQTRDTGKSPHPFQAAPMPRTIAVAPAIGEDVASTIEGNVITDKVT